MAMNLLRLSSILSLFLAHDCVSALPRPAVDNSFVVYNPPITYPTTNTIWTAGTSLNVTWGTLP
jgi:hypothetical protein